MKNKALEIYLGIMIISAIMLQGCQFFPTQPVYTEPALPPQQTTVKPPEILLFEINPAEITLGQAATLSWQVTDADEIDLSPDLGYVPATGSRTVTPVDRMVYTLKAVNKGGSTSKSVTVTVNKNLRAKDYAFGEEELKSKGFKMYMDSEPVVKECLSTYRILFKYGDNFIENTVYVYANKEFMKKIFDEDKYNSRTYITNNLLLIGDEGYVMTDKNSEPGMPDTYSIKFLKSNVYVKLISNCTLDEVESLARIVESRIH